MESVYQIPRRFLKSIITLNRDLIQTLILIKHPLHQTSIIHLTLQHPSSLKTFNLIRFLNQTFKVFILQQQPFYLYQTHYIKRELWLQIWSTYNLLLSIIPLLPPPPPPLLKLNSMKKFHQPNLRSLSTHHHLIQSLIKLLTIPRIVTSVILKPFQPTTFNHQNSSQTFFLLFINPVYSTLQTSIQAMTDKHTSRSSG